MTESIMNITHRGVVVRFQFEAWHTWEDAPAEHEYLRYPHRHMFYVEAMRLVTHNNRDVEFIELKRRMKEFCEDTWGVGHERGRDYDTDVINHNLSCEMMAEVLCQEFGLNNVGVYEDNENGAVVYSRPKPIENVKSYAEKTIKQEFPAWSKDVLDQIAKEIKQNVIGRGLIVGLEAEGPYYGDCTIFIPGDYQGTIDDIACILQNPEKSPLSNVKIDSLPSRWNLYFGAKEKRTIPKHFTYDGIETLRQMPQVNKVLIEFEELPEGPDPFNKFFQFTWIQYVADKLSTSWESFKHHNNLWIKWIDRDNIIWQNSMFPEALHVNSVDDPNFATDQEI